MKKGSGTVAGVKTFVDEENDPASNKKGLVVVPLEGDLESLENQELIKNISSSFSDEVNVTSSEDGVSGVITSREDPDDSYLYLVMPVGE